MNFNKEEIITLEDNREFKIINAIEIDENEYLYLKNINKEEYTIVKVIENKLYNLTNHELSLILSNILLRSSC